MKSVVLAGLIAKLLVYPLLSASPSFERDKPNIIWMNCEDIGPALGGYGDLMATTLNLDQMAKEGMLFEKTYAMVPICSPSRSALITGIYATSLGTQHLRSDIKRTDFVKTLPEILKAHGYFTSNYGKTDYNFDAVGMYDYRESDLFPWKNRKKGKPFFSYSVFGMTHGRSVNFTSKWKENTKNLDAALFHDPADISVPIYHPNSEAFKDIWAHYYDNITAFYGIVGQMLKTLEADGLNEDTIVFFPSDHNPGLPKYKRWLYNTGLRLPLVAYIPKKYSKKYGLEQGMENNELVSLVDFAPTILKLANIPVPESMEGVPFLGDNPPETRTHIIGARSRADNMYEKSRAVIDGKFIYIRNYVPHLPFILPGYIFSDVKESFAELHGRREAGALLAESERMFGTKVPEELYNLQNDPEELENLAYLPEHKDQLQKMREQLRTWVLEARDTGFLPEVEYIIRSKESTPYEMAHDPKQYDLVNIFKAAELVGTHHTDAIINAMQHPDSGLGYWGLIASKADTLPKKTFISHWAALLKDTSPPEQIMASEYLLQEGQDPMALAVLEKWVQDNRGWLALQAARSIELVSNKAKPLVPILKHVLVENSVDHPNGLPYKDYMFSAFTSWSIKWVF